MADSKISQLPALTTTEAEDLLLIIDDPNGTPANKKITLKNLFGSVSANTIFSANVHVTGNKFHVASNTTITKATTVNTFNVTVGSNPATNNTTTEGWGIGRLHFSNTHLYIAVNATTIKRLQLSTY